MAFNNRMNRAAEMDIGFPGRLTMRNAAGMQPMRGNAGMAPMGMGAPTVRPMTPPMASAGPAMAPGGAAGIDIGFKPTPSDIGMGGAGSPPAGGPAAGGAINPMAMMAAAQMMRGGGGARPAPAMQTRPMMQGSYNPMAGAMARRRMRGM